MLKYRLILLPQYLYLQQVQVLLQELSRRAIVDGRFAATVSEMTNIKIIEENTNLQTEAGVKLERRELDLWPLVEGLIHDLRPVAGTGSTKLINKVPHRLVAYEIGRAHV